MPGRAALVGTVRLQGRGVAARVSVHRLGDVDPIRGRRLEGSERQMIERGGIWAMFGLAPEAPVREGSTDGEGRFAFAAPPAGIYGLWARGEGGRTGYATLVVPAAGVSTEVDVDLGAGTAVLRGRILRIPGEAFHGAVVAIPERGDHRDSGPVARARTDDDGSFGLSGLDPGRFRLAALDDDGLGAMSAPVEVPREGPFVWTLFEGDVVTVDGRVVADDDESPVPDARVLVAFGRRQEGMALLRATTGTEGRFRVQARGRPTMVMGTAPSFGAAQAGVEPGEEVVLRLPRLFGVTGVVVEKATGRALEGVPVVAVGTGWHDQGVEASTSSDASGRFALGDLEAGPHFVFALGGGWMSASLPAATKEGFNPFSVEAGTDPAPDLRLEVVPAAVLTGTVTAADGTPVAGAWVEPVVVATRTSSLGIGCEGVTATGKDGGYRLASLLPGVAYRVEASAPGQAAVRGGPVTPAPGEDNPPLPLVFPAERWVEVAVIEEPGGAPVAGAEIRARQRDAASSQPIDGAWTTDAKGLARVGPLPSATIGLSVRSAAHVPPDGEVAVAPDAERAEVRLRRGVEIAGRVVFPEGAEETDGRIDVEALDVVSFRGGDARVAGDGTFRIRGLLPGRYRLGFWGATDLGGSVVVEAPAEDVVLRLEAGRGPFPADFPGGGPVGRPRSEEHEFGVVVVDPDGRPVPTGQVRVMHPGGSYGTNLHDGRARVQLSRLEGEAWILVHDLPKREPPLGAGLYGPFPLARGTAAVRLVRGAGARIRVVDPEGEGVPGVRVALLTSREGVDAPRSFDIEHNAALTRHTDADGVASAAELRAGAWWLDLVPPPDYVKPSLQQVEIASGTIVVELMRGREVEVKVLDPDGGPVAGADVSVSGGVEASAPFYPPLARASTNAEGVARLTGLDPDERDLVLHVTTTREDALGRTVEGWSGGDVTVRLERAWVTEGVVEDPRGQPVPGAVVWHRLPGDSGAGGEQADAQGRFRIGPSAGAELEIQALRQGEHPITVPWPGQEDEGPAWTRVQAGRRDVVLVLDPGVDLVVRIRPWARAARVAAHLSREGGDPGWGMGDATWVESDGVLRAKGLDRDATYVLWVPPDAEGGYVLRRGIPGDAGEVVVAPEAGGTVRGRIRWEVAIKPKTLQVRVYGAREVQVQGKVEPDGRYEIRGVPPGTWTLQAWASPEGGGPTLQAVAEAAPGATVDLVLARP